MHGNIYPTNYIALQLSLCTVIYNTLKYYLQWKVVRFPGILQFYSIHLNISYVYLWEALSFIDENLDLM